jgi:hypothetical protein
MEVHMKLSRYHRMVLGIAVAGFAILALALFAVRHGKLALACAL